MLIVVTVAAAALAARGFRRRRIHRIERRTLESLVETTDLLLATLRAGYSIPQATLMMADIAPNEARRAFAAMRAEIGSGGDFTEALSSARDILPDPFRPLIGLVISAMHLGIPTDALMFQLQTEARHCHRRHGETLARELPIRLTLPLVLCTLPSFVFLIIIPMIVGTVSQLRLDGA